MSFKISVIIPCFNSEEYLHRSVTSVINQSFGFENIELILYDDCSTDSTKDIILEYAKQFNNIIPIFADENSGPGKGRNEGIKVASSEHIMFLDSDDSYDYNMCETLFKEINAENADLVSCSYLNIDSFGKEECIHRYYCNNGEKEVDGKLIFNSRFQFTSGGVTSTCIFKRRIILENNIKFLEESVYEDEYFLIQYYYHAYKVVYLKNYFGINRFVQNDSASSLYTLDEINIGQDHIQDLFDNIKDENFNFSQIFGYRIFTILLGIYISKPIFKSKNDLKKLLMKVHDFENEINFDEKLPLIVGIANYFIRFEHYNIAIIFLRFLNILHDSRVMRKVYRLISG